MNRKQGPWPLWVRNSEIVFSDFGKWWQGKRLWSGRSGSVVGGPRCTLLENLGGCGLAWAQVWECPARCVQVGQSQAWEMGAGRGGLGAPWRASGNFVQGCRKTTKCGPPSDDQKMGRLGAKQSKPCVCHGVPVFGSSIQGPHFLHEIIGLGGPFFRPAFRRWGQALRRGALGMDVMSHGPPSY